MVNCTGCGISTTFIREKFLESIGEYRQYWQCPKCSASHTVFAKQSHNIKPKVEEPVKEEPVETNE